MRLIRIASTPWLHAREELYAVHALGSAAQRVLAHLAGPWVAPALSPRLPTPVALVNLVRALGGRMVVANPNVAAALPREVAALARAVLAARLDGSLYRVASTRDDGDATAAPTSLVTVRQETPSRTGEDARRVRTLLDRLPDAERARLADQGPMRWVAAALLEPRPVSVQLADPGGETPTAPARFFAEPRYRLVLAAGAGAPPTSWDALDASEPAVIAWPPAREHIAWFSASLLVPDALAAEEMDDATLARWAALTGRAGPASRDRYWFAESWERFREPGRMVGHLTPQLVARSRHTSSGARDSGEYGVGGALALTPHVERGTAVPPGYCLVDCFGTLELALVTA